jgi:hypothetical protein
LYKYARRRSKNRCFTERILSGDLSVHLSWPSKKLKMQQQLIEGFIVDHLEMPGKASKMSYLDCKKSEKYDSSGRSARNLTEHNKAMSCKGNIPSPPKKHKQMVMKTRAKRLIRSACAEHGKYEGSGPISVSTSIQALVSPRQIGKISCKMKCNRANDRTNPQSNSFHTNGSDNLVQKGRIPSIPDLPYPPGEIPREKPIHDHCIPIKAPLNAWGISREYIMEFIRLSVIPTTWSM